MLYYIKLVWTFLEETKIIQILIQFKLEAFFNLTKSIPKEVKFGRGLYGMVMEYWGKVEH